MDQKLREEFRAFKVEAEDRINRLETAVKALSEPAKGSGVKADEPKPLGASGEKKA